MVSVFAPSWRGRRPGREEFDALVRDLATLGYPVLSSRRLPSAPNVIDHLFFAPSGVFTVGVKTYLGRVDTRTGRHATEGIDLRHLASCVRRQAISLERIAARQPGSTACAVTPVLCFLGADVARGANVDEVRLLNIRDLGRMLRAAHALPVDRARRLAAAFDTALLSV